MEPSSFVDIVVKRMRDVVPWENKYVNFMRVSTQSTTGKIYISMLFFEKSSFAGHGMTT